MSETTLQTLASETLDAEKQRVMVLLIIASALALFARSLVRRCRMVMTRLTR